ncbi:alpha/beta fold hydrolase [Portibacter lacus]|uniref:Hydrolase n=1 Tax=Portibacter lacus TaxID=1099794 RepID=A0AA37SUW2_9BACT|nr:alpha/beta hydrolase [Portibacter lacus]GLR20014.1 hydrolase [Portibacter lacus]
MEKIISILILTAFLTGCTLEKSIPQIDTFDEIEYPYEVKKQELSDGKSIAYMEVGQGDPIIFIHGLGSYAPAWKKNIDQLSKNYRCIAIDLPGYGKSSKGKYEASMSAYADNISEFITLLGLEIVTLAGHSMGGQISMMTALAYPDQIDRLILISPAGFETFSPGQKQWLRDILTPRAVKLTTVDNIIANMGANFYKMPKDANFMITDRIAMRKAKGFDAYCYIIPECVKGMVDEPVYDYLDRIKQKTLVVFGDDDNLIPNRFLNAGKTSEIAKSGSDKIENATLHLVKKAGHFVHFEKSDEVNGLISNFLN